MHSYYVHDYSKKVEFYNKEIKALEKAFLLLYLFRLGTFIVFVACLVGVAYLPENWFLPVLSFVSFCSFLFAVKKDLKLVGHQQWLKKKLLVNQNELKYFSHTFKEFYGGDEFVKLDPHLAGDFDLFGDHSLFQYLNRSTTSGGVLHFAKSLSKWTHEVAGINNKQEGIKELAGKPDFMENFQAAGMLIAESGNEQARLVEWLKESNQNISKLKSLVILYPVALSGILLLVILGFIPFNALWLPFSFSFFVVFMKKKIVDEAHNKLGRSAKTFEKYSNLIELVEKENFNSNFLQQQQLKFSKKGSKSSQSLRQLFILLEKFDYRYNLVVAILFNVLFLFDLQIYYRLLKWKKQHRDVVADWFESLSEVDGLIGFARFAHNNRTDVVYPDVESGDFCFSSVEMGHPLIPMKLRVNNDVSFCGQPKLMVVTGANMAGKSTFLRTLVVNLILALNGAPVCAKSFRFSPCDIMSSINIRDSLSHQASYFYSELVRIREIIDHVKANPKTLVVLDEILRGTNTKDKQTGSIGLLEKLISLDAIVIVATHDLTIGDLEHKYPEIVTNHCFEVELENDQLIFDYKLKNGVGKKLNASFLMKKMGVID